MYSRHTMAEPYGEQGFLLHLQQQADVRKHEPEGKKNKL